MGAKFKSLNFYVLFSLDAVLVLGAHTLAYLTRFEGAIPPEYLTRYTTWILFFSGIKLGCFFFFNLYRGMWRYTSLPELFNILRAVTLASLLMVSLLLITQRFQGYSRSVFILDWLYTLILITGLRMSIRMAYGQGLPSLARLIRRNKRNPAARRCVLLGAGEVGEKLVRDALVDPSFGLEIVGVFDDDKSKQGYLLHGLPVVGPIEAMPGWVGLEKLGVREALIAMPSITGSGLRRVISLCEKAGLPYKMIPSLGKIAQGRISVKDLRDVDYRDLLGREQARLDTGVISGYLEGRVVMVTGAGGSIGSELCRQIIPFKPKRLLMLDANEYNLYSLQMELTHEWEFREHEAILGNLQDRTWTGHVLMDHRPEVLFHAAAYKHVPMLEEHPWQAVLNNVKATADLLDMAVKHGVGTFLFVSTDKAVRPTNVMGASKRLTERLMQACRGGRTRMMAVRFGNVLGSAGSVIPLFRRQIERGGPVTVTDPRIVRYFMTIEEACQLILQAGAMGGGGEIFVLNMGRQVNIAEMAEDLIRLSGKEPGRDIEIKFIGLRPGEKLYEELMTADENVVPTAHDQIMVLKGGECSMDELAPLLREIVEAALARDGEVIRALLKKGVPEYNPDRNGEQGGPGPIRH